MAPPNAPALEFLLTRRSRPVRTLGAPIPTREELRPILTAATRCPDHGKLEPWRLIVLHRPALLRLADAVIPCGARLGIEADRVQKLRAQFAEAHLAVAVVGVPMPSDKVPEIEQMLSAGAVCLSLLNAALASGWGASWLTGWAVHDPQFCAETLGLAEHEFVAGLIHIGTESAVPPDRPRPDLDRIVTWVDA